MTVGRIPNIEGGIQPTLLTTTGDIMYASSASNPARLGIGSTGQVLTVAAGVPSWAAAGGALALSTIASGSLTSGTTLTLSSLSSYDYLIVVLNGLTWTGGNSRPTILINNDSSGVYVQAGYSQGTSSTYTTRNLTSSSVNLGFGASQTDTDASNTYIATLTNCKSAGFTNVNVSAVYASGGDIGGSGQYVYKVAAAVSSLVVGTLNGRTFNGSGTYQLLGA